MPKDLAKEFVKVRNRLIEERTRIVERLEYLNQVLATDPGPGPPASEIQTTASGLPPIADQKPKQRRAASHNPRPANPKKTAAPESISLEITPEAYNFPVGMFPFPGRALGAFVKAKIEKLGQLEKLDLSTLKAFGNFGKTTLSEIAEVIAKVNNRTFFYPPNEAIPTSEFASLIDQELKNLPEHISLAVRLRFGAESSDPWTLEAIGERLQLTRERIRQLIDDGVSHHRQFHGAKFFQIGKALGVIARERPLIFSDISDPHTPVQWRPEFYFCLLHQTFPGLKDRTGGNQEIQTATSIKPEDRVPGDLRDQIFGDQ